MHTPRIVRTGALSAALGSALALGVSGVAAAAQPHHLSAHHKAPAAHAVFVQTDNLTANKVVSYLRGADGRLSDQHAYATGGRGDALAGAVVDDLASQGSLDYDAAAKLLFAVNAGSDTVTTFAVSGDELTRKQVISSGGDFPVSVSVHGKLVYVLNALDGGSLHGYRITGGKLASISGSTRELGLDPTKTPQFVSTPGQVAFTPSGSQLLVTTKNNTNAVDVYTVASSGILGAEPVVNQESGDVPFGVAFEGRQVDVSEAGPDAVASFTLSSSGTLTQLSSADTGEMATCWLVADGKYLLAGNAGSGEESVVTDGAGGELTLSGTDPTDAGTVDATTADAGKYLYVQTGGAGIVDEYAVAGGVLLPLGSVDVPNSKAGEGIAAS